MFKKIIKRIFPFFFLFLTACISYEPPVLQQDIQGEDEAILEKFFELNSDNPGSEKELPELRTDNLSAEEINCMQVYRDTVRSVVNITSVSLYESRFWGTYSQQGSGSGVLLDSKGIIITNRHVIEGTSYLVVTLYDGSNYKAEVLGQDSETDLAVLKIDAADRELFPLNTGVSSELQIGQKVLALGNPYGLEGTLTAGIVSGLNRPVATGEGYVLRGLIQTDAAINPGNSGGALLNSRGELVGINTMILSPSGGSVGIGFSVPIDTALRIVPELIQEGQVRRGWIPIQAVNLTPRLAAEHDESLRYGILVINVEPGSSAEEAGLRGGNRILKNGGRSIPVGGDVILEVNGVKIKNIADYLSALENTHPGDEVPVTINRMGKEWELAVTLTTRSENFR